MIKKSKNQKNQKVPTTQASMPKIGTLRIVTWIYAKTGTHIQEHNCENKKACARAQMDSQRNKKNKGQVGHTCFNADLYGYG